MDVGWLPILWFGLGITIVVCALRARRSPGSYRAGIVAVSALWVGGGAGANLYFLARGDDFSGFADVAWSDFVQDTWESLVVPHHTIFIGLLIAFEAGAGALVLIRGPVRQAALIVLMAFNIALLSFGWAYLLWSAPMVVALELLRRAGAVREDTLIPPSRRSHPGSARSSA